MKFVVLSYPRTGSTVIQRLINTDRNSICVGEKPMAINALYDFYSSVESTKLDIPSLFPDIPLSDDRNPVFNADKVDLSLLTFMIREMYEDAVLCANGFNNVGWKENFISSYHDQDAADKQILFIKKLFPDVRFILNVRDPIKCSMSKIWAVRDEAVEEISHRRNWMLDRFKSGLFGNGSVVTDYDRWSRNGETILGQLWDFGFRIDYDECKVILSEQLTHLKD